MPNLTDISIFFSCTEYYHDIDWTAVRDSLIFPKGLQDCKSLTCIAVREFRQRVPEFDRPSPPFGAFSTALDSVFGQIANTDETEN